MSNKKWALIAAARNTGGSSTAARVVAALQANGLSVAGVVQEAIEEDGQRVAYLARRVSGVSGSSGSSSVVIARRGVVRGPTEVAFCSFAFDDAAFKEARAWLKADAPGASIVVLDEVSKLEVSGGGHHDAIVEALSGAALPILILVVRADQLFAVMERFGLDEPVAALEETSAEATDAFVHAVVRALAYT